MQWRFRAPTFVLLAWLSTTAAASAESITFRFEGRVEATTGTVPPSVGDTMSGSVSFDIPGTDAPPGSLFGFFQTRQDVFHLIFSHEPGRSAFDERTLRRQLFTTEVFNDFAAPGSSDQLGITLSTFTFPQFGFHIDLVDLTGSAFANANLPGSVDLDAFQVRHFLGNFQERRGGGQVVVGTFDGRITSLVEGPGPNLVPEPCSLFLVGPAFVGIVARARAKRRSTTE